MGNNRSGLKLGFLGWPLLLYSTITRKTTSASGDAEIAWLFFAPVGFVYAARELLKPSLEVKIITNTAALSKERKEDYPAVLLNYSNDPKKFSDLELVFPNDISLRNGGACRQNNQKCLEKYKEATYFLPVEKTLKEKLYASINLEEKRIEERIQFGRRLQETDQVAFLQKIGFL